MYTAFYILIGLALIVAAVIVVILTETTRANKHLEYAYKIASDEVLYLRGLIEELNEDSPEVLNQIVVQYYLKNHS